ncbi:xanthine phosphoribosyltransferase 2 [Clostridia bacterium]|nr:xanthine phosphoribosyltransferase 2 [Clostridia bacterium]
MSEGSILRVDSFLNHNVDIKLQKAIGDEFRRLFKDTRVDKILTIEASGICAAAFTAMSFGVDMVFAKKYRDSLNRIPGDVYSANIHSFTHDYTYRVVVRKNYILPGENILIIDDFLANGLALRGLIEIVKSAGANLVGAGICIEKGFQSGGDRLREEGVRVESLAIIDSMDGGKFVFRE